MEKNLFDDRLQYDNVEQVKEKIDILRKGAKKGKLLDVEFRITQLKKLRALAHSYEKQVQEANKRDLGMEYFMSYYSTFTVVSKDLDEIIANVRGWAKPRHADTPALLAPASSYIIPEPFGVCLVMGSWNAQFLTLLMPVAQAIAAGNVVLAKPSEMAEGSAILCQKMFDELDPDCIQTLQGGAEVCIELLKHKFDIIIFTGSPEKGRLVALAAAQHLTPCILELGGQNPVIVDESANLANTVYNILNGRFLNSGQICLSPEYVMICRSKHKEFLELLKKTAHDFYNGNPKESQDYSKMINEFHTQRLIDLIQSHGGNLLTGGEHDLKEKYVSPTIVTFDSFDHMSKSPLTSSEIFGPILYVLPYDNLDECLDYINSKDKPLVLYYFGSNSANKEKIKKYTSSGAFVCNDTVVHFTVSSLPFGGVGKSGYGAYHGKHGFDSLSHLKPVFDRSQILLKLRYPPFTQGKQKIFKFLLDNVHLTQEKLKNYSGLLLTIFFVYYFRNSLPNLNLFKK
jgi:aldehyde dehydrogenase (NAD+)